MSRRLEDLHPVVKEQAENLRRLAKELLGLDIIFTQTLRTEREQIALYAQGRKPLSEVNSLRTLAGLGLLNEEQNKSIVTKAKTVKDSWHAYGLAFDIAIVDSTKKKINWNHSDWNNNNLSDWDEVGKLADKVGLEWGGNWSGMCDPPHFQNRRGYTLAQLKSGLINLT